MYRPEFSYPDPTEPCVDQRCQYSFDATNTPALAGNIGTPLLSKIPLLMDTDAPFFLRGIVIQSSSLQVRLEDCNENPLSDSGNLIATTNYEYPELYAQTDGAGIEALDSDAWGVYLPAGGAVLLCVFNPAGTDIGFAAAGLFINLHGVKRYGTGGCK